MKFLNELVTQLHDKISMIPCTKDLNEAKRMIGNNKIDTNYKHIKLKR